MRRTTLFAALAIALMSCASVGTKVDPQVVGTFRPGVTTYADVIGKLGRPSSELNSFNGTRTVTYTYAQSQVRPVTFVPFVGAFAGGSDTTSSSWSFQFAPDGKLLGDSSSSSQMPVSTGLAAGTP